jgi:hypothetical protein
MPSLTPVVEIGSANPANVYGGNRLQKPYAKTKVDESCTCMMLIGMADGCCYRVRNAWNSNFRIRILNNNRTIIG